MTHNMLTCIGDQLIIGKPKSEDEFDSYVATIVGINSKGQLIIEIDNKITDDEQTNTLGCSPERETLQRSMLNNRPI